MHLAESIVLSSLDKRCDLYSIASQDHIHLSIGEAIPRITEVLAAMEAMGICKLVSNYQMLIGGACHGAIDTFWTGAAHVSTLRNLKSKSAKPYKRNTRNRLTNR